MNPQSRKGQQLQLPGAARPRMGKKPRGQKPFSTTTTISRSVTVPTYPLLRREGRHPASRTKTAVRSIKQVLVIRPRTRAVRADAEGARRALICSFRARLPASSGRLPCASDAPSRSSARFTGTRKLAGGPGCPHTNHLYHLQCWPYFASHIRGHHAGHAPTGVDGRLRTIGVEHCSLCDGQGASARSCSPALPLPRRLEVVAASVCDVLSR